MNAKFNQQFLELTNQLEFLKLEEPNQIIRFGLAIDIIFNAIKLLKKAFIGEKGKTQEFEIEFFKTIKPKFMAQLIFHTTVLDIETKLPLGSKISVRKYLKNEQKKIDNFYKNNTDFLKYYNGNLTHFDEKYFIRKNFDAKLALDNIYNVTDKKFSTLHDFTVSKIIAYQLIADYLTTKINALKSKNTNSQVIHNSVKWTAKKVDLVELLYALQISGSINNGNTSLKELTSKFELFFNFKLDNINRTFIEIQERKTDKTKFLSILEVGLISKIENSEI